MTVAAESPSTPRRHPARRRSLAWRLGLLLGVAVLGVLLLVGIVVNRVVSGSFETVLTAQQQQRLDDAAVTLADRLSRPAGLARAQALVTRIATSLGGEVRVVGLDGTTLAAFGRTPTGDPAHYAVPIEGDGGIVATLEADLPGTRRRPRLPAAVQRHARWSRGSSARWPSSPSRPRSPVG